MKTFPSVFLSHGSPDLPLQSGPALDFLRQLGSQLGQPQVILCISAHWGSPSPLVSGAVHPETIHDFYGFPPQLYQLTYPASGAPEMAQTVAKLLEQADLSCQIDPERGLDHGAWCPLSLMYPEAGIPVLQLSVQPHLGTAHHLRLGRALEPLRHQGVLILASGGATHNLREFGGYAYDAVPPDWVSKFDYWLNEKITQGNVEELVNYHQLAPHAVRNHPSEEHLLPLFVAVGAGGEGIKGQQLHSSFTHGLFSMAAYAFG